MSLNFSIRQYINPDAAAQGTCYEDKISQTYDFTRRGVVEVLLHEHRSMCNA